MSVGNPTARCAVRVGVVLLAALALVAAAGAATAAGAEDRPDDEVHIVCPEDGGGGHGGHGGGHTGDASEQRATGTLGGHADTTAPVATAAGASGGGGGDRGGGGLNAPGACEYHDVQAAVNASTSGDLVYLQPGTYHQYVYVRNTSDLTLAGAGRDETVLVGNKRANGSGHHDAYDGVYVSADNVTVRDLEVREFQGNGVYYTDVVDFRVTRVDAIDNGAYGIYAIRSTLGTFEDSYAAGHYDSGFYLGEVRRCECTIRNVTAEANLIGYSGTGASYITIEDSTWVDNAAGIVPNVLPNEPAPQTHLRVVDNEIRNNNNRTAYREFHFAGSLHAPVGSGVVIGGGSFNTVADNRIRNHSRAGVLITNMFTEPAGNAVVRNEFERNDLDVWWDGGGPNNCVSDNDGSPENGSVTFDAGAYWNARGDLPACNDRPSEGVLDPRQLAEIATPVVFGCEFEQLPGANVTSEDGCHVEEPDPHVHPPESSGSYSVAELFGEAAAERVTAARTRGSLVA